MKWRFHTFCVPPISGKIVDTLKFVNELVDDATEVCCTSPAIKNGDGGGDGLVECVFERNVELKEGNGIVGEDEVDSRKVEDTSFLCR